MDRFKRIAHRGWLRRFLSVATFGYYPLSDGVDYVVSGDVNIRIAASYGTEMLTMAAGAVEAMFYGVGSVEFAPSPSGNVSIRMATNADSVEL